MKIKLSPFSILLMIIGLMSQKFWEIKMLTSNDDEFSTFIRFDNGVFKINDVLGDGDCFLHFLNISQHINMPGTEELRKYIFQNLRQENIINFIQYLNIVIYRLYISYCECSTFPGIQPMRGPSGHGFQTITRRGIFFSLH